MPDALGVGVIGLGEIGQFHLRGYARSRGARPVAVADMNATLVASSSAEYDTLGFHDYHELIADPGVQVISICLPHSLHTPVTIEAVRAGKHVLVEKPLAISVAECDQILAAAQSAKVIVGLQHNQIFYPAHVRAKELIDSGAIGRPLQLRLRLAIGGKYQGWRTDPAVAGGGILFDAGVHRFYLARYLFGEIVEVSAVTDKPRTDGEDQAVVSLRFGNGALGVIDASYHGPAKMFDDAVEIVGTEGALYLSGVEAEFEGFRTGPALRLYDGAWHDLRVPGGDWADSVAASIQAFVDAVRTDAEPPVPLREGRRVVELIEMAYAG
ncbi:Gfo/Idh/MocA family protein [Mycolicibacterium baixiangningiae]|uniref:Gfo/Idh/MocA family protein n=1 Tax=Mycolicibacterium baixiangningiae TaxID=2761578 RepID=UPI0018D02C51|nr:Gfo/Idh/MocA family oxidoreductase [Mycolicibacterium baixiangningiae]